MAGTLTRRPGDPPKISAHRGGAEGANAPNSLDAIRAATSLGLDFVEFDVRVTADGRFVVWHDKAVWIDGAKVPVERVSFGQLRLHAPDAADVADVLQLLRGRVLAHVDMKDPWREVELADLCESVLGADGFLLTTLDDESVKRVRQARPHLQIALSLGRSTRGEPWWREIAIRWSEVFPARRVRDCDPTALAINYRICRAGALRWAHRQGIPVLVWTINRPALMRKVVADGRYWAFTTDKPRLAIGLLRAK